MSVLIKGMEMPKNCCECRLLSGFECRALFKDITDFSVADECPLVPVPPHGRLIDENDFFSDDIVYPDKLFEKTMREFVSDMPTIIEAEGE